MTMNEMIDLAIKDGVWLQSRSDAALIFDPKLIRQASESAKTLTGQEFNPGQWTFVKRPDDKRVFLTEKERAEQEEWQEVFEGETIFDKETDLPAVFMSWNPVYLKKFSKRDFFKKLFKEQGL
jgi:hypothetical protein